MKAMRWLVFFFSDADERSIRRLDRGTGEVTTVVELTDPTQVLGILRAGVSCPDGFHLFVAEPSADRVTRVVPEQGLTSLFTPVAEIQDVAFLTAGELSGSEAVLTAGQISDISPLVANMGLGGGDQISLGNNLVDAGDCGDINSLTGRGVFVDIAASLCP